MTGSIPSYRHRLRQTLQRMDDAMFTHARPSRPMLVTMSAIGIVAMLAYYPVWTCLWPQPYESLPLRLAGSLVLLPLVLQRWWPRYCRKFLPAYWYAAITFVLPFFVGYMLLRNGGSTVWLLTHLTAIYLTMMMFELGSFMAILLLGSVLAWLAFVLGPHGAMPWQQLSLYLPVLLISLTLGPLASLSQKFADHNRIQALERASNNIAHELRTPLGALQIAGRAFRRYLPDLLESHRLAQQAGLPVAELRGAHLQALEKGMDTIEQEVGHAHMVIDMLLVAARPLDDPALEEISAGACVRQALERYPYASRSEQARVRLARDDDFTVRGSETLLMHVIFNLLRNALFHTGRAGKGSIDVTVQAGPDMHEIRVRDTGPGIPADVLPRIFNRFYSYSEDRGGVAGLGIGLAFSRDAVERMGGRMACRSRLGEYTEFVITFPLRDTDARA